MKPPKISVCIPVYNCEKFIRDAIDSVLVQTCVDFELIVLDNHSTDGTLAVVEKYRDERLRVMVNRENIGAEGNWNLALAEARGEYIKILCADDMLHPECLEKQCRIMEENGNQDVMLVSSIRNVINESNKILMKRGLTREGRISGPATIKKIMRAGTNIIGEPSSVLIRRSVLERTGGFNGAIPYIIDLDLWVRILSIGYLYVLAEPLSYFRISRGSWSVAIRKRQRRDFILFMNKMYFNKSYGLSVFDYLLGRCNVVANTLKRNLFYKLVRIFP